MRVKDILEEMGKDLEYEIKNQIQKFNKIKTGDMIRSIRYKLIPIGTNYRIEISTIEYFKFVDEGTVKMAPTPMLQPALDIIIRRYRPLIIKAYKEDITDQLVKKLKK